MSLTQVPQAMLSQGLSAATAQASTSGTSIDFTGIPSWAKRITVMFNGVSTNGSSHVQAQIGAGSVTTTGYVSSSVGALGGGASFGTTATTGIIWAGFGASVVRTGTIVFTNVSGYVWVATCAGADTDGNTGISGGGVITLSGVLDRVRITTVNGTDAFDAGSINIMYE